MEEIKNIVNQPAYASVEAFIRAEIVDRAIHLKTEGKTAEVIALEVMASDIASKKIDKVLRKLRTISAEPKKINNSFK
jgi:hypothetical protein